jgi:hypothetical protein
MKAFKLLLAAVLFTSLATLSFAGPPSDHWAHTQKTQKEQAPAKADAQAKAQPATQVAVCANCNCAAMKKS